MFLKTFRNLLAGLLVLIFIAACGPTATFIPPATSVPTNPSSNPSGSTQPTATSAPVQPTITLAPAAPTSQPPAALQALGSFPNIQSMDMFDASNGWGLTSAQVLRTTDGGTSWYNATPSGVTAGPSSSFFLNPTTAWVIVSGGSPTSGTLYHTSDGGGTWTSASVPFGGGSMHFLDANNGWILVGLGAGMSHEAVAVYQTTNGGANWTQVFTDEPNAPNTSDTLPFVGDKSGISATDMSHAWVTGSEPMSDFVYVYSTQDGGKTWTSQNPALPSTYAGAMTNADPPHFFSGGVGVLPVSVAGNTTATVLYVSHDNGQTWTATTPVPLNWRASLPDGSDFFVWDGGTALYASQDAGATWTTITPNVNLKDSLNSYQFVDAKNGWAITSDASGTTTLYQTTDGGASWNVLNP